MQWSADVTEPAHITEIKVPSHAMNNQDYESQIMRHLDRAEKCQRFDLATALQDPEDQQAAVRIIEEVANSPDHAEDDAPLIHRLARFLPFQVNYFAQSASLLKGKVPSAPHPYRTFAAEDAAFHLSRDPAYRRVVINDIVETFNLPDLLAALAQYAHRLMSGHCTHAIGGHRLPANIPLPFDCANVWAAMCIQGKAYHYPHDPLPPQTIHASPAFLLPGWLSGRHDPVVINIDPSKRWPRDGLKGKFTNLCYT